MVAQIRIGTSGWNYKHWMGSFYPPGLPQKELLAFYARHFDTVEINNSFYRLPELETFQNWRETVPRGFTFAVKGSRFITHMKKLKDPKSSSQKLFDHAAGLEDKLGPILFQLPPRWHANYDRLSEFLDAIPREHRYAIEFRDPSWLSNEIFDLLRKHRVAFCIHDLRGEQSPRKITSDFTYIRMHGPGVDAYSGSYSQSSLQKWSDQLIAWQPDLKAIYVYFNNDVGGNAIKNAISLRKMVSRQ